MLKQAARAWRPAAIGIRRLSSVTAQPAWSRQDKKIAAFALAGTGLALTVSSPALALPKSVDWNAVRKDIIAVMDSEDNRRQDGTGVGPTFVRLAWHASGTYSKEDGVGGSNGANMRFVEEAGIGANQGLHLARELLAPLAAKYGCSHADLWTFAGKVAVEEMGGPVIPWRPGRTDADNPHRVAPDGRLPDASKDASHLRSVFGRMNFSDQEIVALSGAHALGRCHRDNSGYWGPWTNAETTFSNEYFRLLLEEKWTEKKTHNGKAWGGPLQYENPQGNLMMLPTDMEIVRDPEFRKYAEAYAKDEGLFQKDFAAAFSKLMELGVPFPGTASAPVGLFHKLKSLLGFA